jgi:hypothetical protein
MLWYKGWLEVRIRLLVSIVVMCFGVYMARTATLTMGTLSRSTVGSLMFGNTIVVALACLWLAGAGIITQPAFQAVKGIHGSTLFTLSLPVSRLRLLAVRASLGWLLMAGLIGALCGGISAWSPGVRAMATPAEIFEYGVTLLVCFSAFYFFCVLLATFLEDQWRIVGGAISFMAFRALSKEVALPAFADIYGAVGNYSPLITHAVPWGPVCCALGLSAVLFAVALKIVRVREY